MLETLHVDSTTGFFNKLDNRNICYFAACFKGKPFFDIRFLTLCQLHFKRYQWVETKIVAKYAMYQRQDLGVNLGSDSLSNKVKKHLVILLII